LTFLAFETSAEGGRPVELYEFRQGSSEFFFTSAEDSFMFDGLNYMAEIISRSSLVTTTDDSEDRITVTVPATNAFAQVYTTTAPGIKATFTLRKFHRDDTDNEAVQLFKGIIQTVAFISDGEEAKIQVLSLARAQKRSTPRITFQNPCNHMLYDKRCKILETNPSFQKFLNISTVSGSTITADGAGAFGADFFVTGFAKFQDDFRHIIGQATDVLTLDIPFRTTPLSNTIQLNAGCKHRLTTDCRDKFSNVINFGGFPAVPTKNPYEGLE